VRAAWLFALFPFAACNSAQAITADAPAPLDATSDGYRPVDATATVDALQTAPTLRRVIFCCFSKESAALHEQALAGFGKPCAD